MTGVQTSPFVRQLASNSRSVREQALESLRSYLASQQLRKAPQLQFDQLWKGLYFAMWFSDRPRPQQRLAAQLGELSLLFLDGDTALGDRAFVRFSKAFWKVMCLEWYNIDHHRLDKYLLLVRRVLYNQLRFLRERGWDAALVERYVAKVLQGLPLSGSPKVYNGIPFHIIDIFVDEWERLVLRDGRDAEDADMPELPEQRDLIAATPLPRFVAVFQGLAANIANIKILREKIKQDLLADQRLYDWGVLARDSPESDDDDDVEEWHGF
ncbi:AGR158Cp [Eremothecium gossypii ATCC 10895]|uniref:AGR158Cp n=1 Tax=Eremothecium gossypii (strain ATCC 10895 / CBS 109.51 / FGSC 9923 / NRRL Y-1056) TaxID=284811 RepID=Q74ZP0_EREGS|nr:AGR158Cp [Eremothecium gossypii ATCC 10895]AAS54648.1 AGR158Cp [Eremothecium gossypii ATCC 10895]AEY98978.1 FAGR158Cp [Eremothecium gossypii FDAG1]